jgi:hypothetical protein
MMLGSAGYSNLTGAFQRILSKANIPCLAKSFIPQGHYDHKGGTPDSYREWFVVDIVTCTKGRGLNHFKAAA